MDDWRRVLVVSLILLFLVGGVIYSQGEWERILSVSPEERERARGLVAEALREAGIDTLHHELFREAGPERWYGALREDVRTLLTGRVVRDTGNPLPTDEEILQWAREHRDELQRLMREWIEAYRQLRQSEER